MNIAKVNTSMNWIFESNVTFFFFTYKIPTCNYKINIYIQ